MRIIETNLTHRHFFVPLIRIMCDLEQEVCCKITYLREIFAQCW